jgi:MFS family permease
VDPTADDQVAAADGGGLFRSLRYPGAKRYFLGLAASMVGTWMQSIALSWLVVKDLGGGGSTLALLQVFQFAPMLVLGAWAGALSDRLDKRRLMLVTQTAMGGAALALAALDFTGRATLGPVLALAFVAGVAQAFDTPVRRAMVGDLVPPAAVPNAMSLNTGVITSSRVLGMAVGGYVTRFWGTSWCFLANGLSYLAMIAAIIGMVERAHATRSAEEGGSARDGLRHVWRSPVLRPMAIGLTIVATFTYNYTLTFPLIVKEVFGRDADGLGTIMAFVSVGSFAGAMLSAKRRRPSLPVFFGASLGMGLTAAVGAASPTYVLCVAAMVPMGLCAGLLMAQSSGLFTWYSPSTMRGRVLALQSVVFIGSTPIGAPVIGAVADHVGPRWGLGVGAVAAVAVGLVGLPLAVSRSRPGDGEPGPGSATDRITGGDVPSPPGPLVHATMRAPERRSFPGRSRLS